MNERTLAYIVGLAALLGIAGAIGLKLATRRSHDLAVAAPAPQRPTRSPTLVFPETQSLALVPLPLPSPADGSQSNVLELPKVSLNFVGDWGGYTHSSIHSVQPDLLTGETPDRASVIFGRQGDTVFIAAELYSSPNQRILGKPRVRVLGPQEANVQYESEDSELYYAYTCHFTLLDSGRIAYRNRVEVYDRHTRDLVGTVKQRAMLRRLLTANDQLRFARPSRHEVPQREISASTRFVR